MEGIGGNENRFSNVITQEFGSILFEYKFIIIFGKKYLENQKIE
jgi:hypothetical protein